MLKKSIVLVLGVIFLLVVFSSCTKEPQAIKIGAVLPLTGPAATFGEVFKNALQLSTEEINEKGGINGKSVKLIIEDSAGDPKTGVSAFKKLMAIEKPKIVVTTVSSIALALAPFAIENKVVLFAEVSHPKVSGISPYVFRHSKTALQDAELLAGYIQNTLQLKRVSILTVNDDYGEAMNNGLKENLTQVKIIKNLTFDKSEMDFRTLTLRIIPDEPDGVIIVGYGKGLGIAFKRFRELGYKGKIFTGFAFSLTKDAALIAGDAAVGVYYPSFRFSVEEDSQIIAIEKKYIEKYGSTPNDFLYIEYDTMNLIFQALKKVGYNPEKVKDYLHGLGKYKGITGEIIIRKTGDILSPVTIVQYQ